MKPHKHAELIKAWADGAEIQSRYKFGYGDWTEWTDDDYPTWKDEWQYRIKPEPKPDVEITGFIKSSAKYSGSFCDWFATSIQDANIKLTFDGETGELKSAEVLK